MAHQQPRKNELRKEIAALIDSIKSQSDRIGFTRDVPQVDIDLILHTIEQLHRKAVVFSYLNAQPEAEPVVVAPPVVVPEPPKVEPVVVAPPVVVPEPPKIEPVVVAPPVVVPEPPKIEPVVVAPPVVVPEPPKVEPVVVAPPVVVPEPPKVEPVVVAPPVVELAKPLSTPPPQTAVGKDVRGFIGFNEKLMFLRNLFGGDAGAYDEALNHLNTTQSADEANAFLSLLQKEYRWQPDSEPAEAFRSVIKRRFS